MKIASSADWHLRIDRPRCRIDKDWIDSQEKMVEQFIRSCVHHAVEKIFLCGDIFNSSNQPPIVVGILTRVLYRLKTETIPVPEIHLFPGNHDLQYHQYANLKYSALSNLYDMKSVIGHACDSRFVNKDFLKTLGIVIIHRLIMPNANESIARLSKSEIATDVMEEFPEARYILTGDYHRAFKEDYNGQLLLNPGCIVRQKSNEKNYKIGFWILETDTGDHSFIPLKEEAAVIDDAYIGEANSRDERNKTYIERLKKSKGFSFDLWDGVDVRLASEKHSKLSKQILQEVRENE